MRYERVVELLNELAEQCGLSSVCDVDAEGGGQSEVFVPRDEENVVHVQKELDVCECGAARYPLDVVMGRPSRHCGGTVRREGHWVSGLHWISVIGCKDWMCAGR